jgi:hypothetical protein
MGIHLLRCVHGNKHTRTHDVIYNTFVIIARDVGFHLKQKQLHVFISTTFNSLCQRVDIVFTKCDICTLADVVIVDPTQANLLPQSCVTQRFVAFDTIESKEMNYCNRHPIDQFFPLVIEIFGCLHKHADMF